MIYTINSKRCNNCFKCVRECPFDAVRFVNNKASINKELCINCGLCFSICPINAIDYLDGVPLVKQLIKKQGLTVASLAPNWRSEFRGVKEEQMIEALKLLGIKHVSPTSMGAAASVSAMTKYARETKGITISTTCPVVTSTITNFYPHLTPLLSPVEAAHTIHAKMLRKMFGKNAKIIYISSCPAVYSRNNNKKENIDIAITFKELDIWLKEENVLFDKIPGNVEGYHFEPKNVLHKPDYIIPGRTIGDLTCDKPINVECSGMADIKKILRQIDYRTMRRSMFLDMFACRGGCVNGLFSIDCNKTIDSKHYFLKAVNNGFISGENTVDVDTSTSWTALEKKDTFTDDAIEEIMNTLKIDNLPPNCEACGYENCYNFAKGVLTDMADIENCYLRKERSFLSDRETVIENLNCGIVFVNDENRIFLYNKRFAKIMNIEKMSREAIMSQDIFKHMLSKDLHNILKKDVEVEIKINNKLYYILKVPLSNNYNCFIIRNAIDDSTSNSEIEKRTNVIIKDNMETMQKIAYLLGENASKVEGLLRSFIDKK